MRQVAYVSSATKVFRPDEIEALLERARRTNGRSDVTGALFHDAGSFLQILEGAEDDVQRTLTRIRRDPRHEGLTVVWDQAIAEREFEYLSMASHEASDALFHRVRAARRLDRDFIRSLADIVQPTSR